MDPVPAENAVPSGPLGGKTLALLILERAWVLAAAALGVIILAFAPALVPADFQPTLRMAGYVLLAAGLLAAVAGAAIGWLEYRHYRVQVNPSNLAITRGIITEENIGIPYRRIREIKVRREIYDLVFGVSTLIVTIVGEEGEPGRQIALPALDKRLAVDMQHAILNRAQVENEVSTPATFQS